MRALIFGQQSRAHAALGDASESRRAIDYALREISRQDASSDLAAAYCNESYISMEAANALARLSKPERAIPVFERSLSAWPDHLRRDKGLCLARLATAYAASDETERATATGRAAVDVIRSATSGRALLELTRLRRRLAPWRRDAEVSDLCEQVRELTRAA